MYLYSDETSATILQFFTQYERVRCRLTESTIQNVAQGTQAATGCFDHIFLLLYLSTLYANTLSF